MLTNFAFLALAGAVVSGTAPFYLGVSNAAFQVEGSPGDSDWSRWTHSRDANGALRIRDGSDAQVATRFWERYDDDFAMAQGAGMNAFRISVAWERVEPTPGVYDEAALQHYADIIVAMRARGLTPFVTLQHFVLPGWLADQGGLLASDYPAHFARFAAHVVQALSQAPAQVSHFITLNEPNIQVITGYLQQRYPPGLSDPTQATQALAQLARAHVAAYNSIHDLQRANVQVGFSHNWQVYQPADASKASEAQRHRVNQAFNGDFMDAVLTGKLAFQLPGGAAVADQIALPHGPSLDFVGVQNYGRSLVQAQDEAPGYRMVDGAYQRNDLGWEIVPDALYHAVKEIAAYGYPVIVTETGVADRADCLRPQALRDNFAAMRRLRQEGVPLFGYLHWSLTDNFEWDSGYIARFGLVAVDYATQTYTPRPSLSVYRDLIAEFQASL